MHLGSVLGSVLESEFRQKTGVYAKSEINLGVKGF